MPELKITIDVRQIRTAEKTVDKALSNMQKEVDALTKKINTLENTISKSSTKMSSDVKKFSNTTQKELKKSAGAFDGFLKTVKAAAVGYATVLATMEFTQFVSDTFEAGIALDSLERSFKAITGTTAQAAQEMQFLSTTATMLGLNLPVLEKSYKDILAASKGTSLEGKNVRDVFTSISKASAVLGMSADDTQGSLRALSQMISKGNVQAEELRGQLGERLPGAFQLAAEAMGVTTEKLNDMLENGEVLASVLLPRLAKVLEERYGDAAEAAGLRAQAAFENFSNAMVQLQRTLMSKGILDMFAELARDATTVLQAADKIIQGTTVTDQISLLETQRDRLLEQRQAIKDIGIEYQETGKESVNWLDRIADGIAKANQNSQGYREEINKLARDTNQQTDIFDQLSQEVDKLNKELEQLYDVRSLNNYARALEDVVNRVKGSGVAPEGTEDPGKRLKALQKLQRENREKFAEDILRAKMVKDQNLDRLESIRKKQASVDKEIAKRFKQQNEDELKLILIKAKAVDDLNLARLEGLRTLEVSPLEETGPLQDYINSLEESTNVTEAFENATVNAFGAMEDAIVEFATTGKLSFSNFITSMISDLVRFQVQQDIIKPLASGLSSMGGIDGIFSGLFAANGAVTTGLSSAVNSVVSKPTYFPGASGTPTAMMASGGVMIGEGKKEEGVLPLTNVGGELGVKADFSGSKDGGGNVYINIENSAADQVGVETTSSVDDLGNTIIGIWVDAALNNKSNVGDVIRGVASKKR